VIEQAQELRLGVTSAPPPLLAAVLNLIRLPDGMEFGHQPVWGAQSLEMQASLPPSRVVVNEANA